jgi:4-hydroxy-tetrahydrodipicolinate synthase
MFRGSFVAIITPMNDDMSTDWAALERLIEWHIEQGTHGLVAMGTTGESATYNMQEHIDVVRFVIERVAGRIPVIAGTGANSTQEALELTEAAKNAGADGALLVTPYYNRPTQEGLFLHHKYIADRVALPQLLYNVPSRTACDMMPETVGRLSGLPNIVGIKDATGDIQRLRDTQSKVASGFDLFSGDDESACEFLSQGGHGVISVTANVLPAKFAKLCELVAAGQVEEAVLLNAELEELNRVLFIEPNPIPVKYAMAKMGFGHNVLRLPLTPLAEQYCETLDSALRAAGCLK